MGLHQFHRNDPAIWRIFDGIIHDVIDHLDHFIGVDFHPQFSFSELPTNQVFLLSFVTIMSKRSNTKLTISLKLMYSSCSCELPLSIRDRLNKSLIIRIIRSVSSNVTFKSSAQFPGLSKHPHSTLRCSCAYSLMVSVTHEKRWKRTLAVPVHFFLLCNIVHHRN